MHCPNPCKHRITNYASNVHFCVCVLYICFSYLPEKGRQEQVVKVSPVILLKQGFGSGSVGAPGGTGTIDGTSWLQHCGGPSTSVTRPTPVCKDSWFSASEKRIFACWVCLQLAHQNLPLTNWYSLISFPFFPHSRQTIQHRQTANSKHSHLKTQKTKRSPRGSTSLTSPSGSEIQTSGKCLA